MKEINVFDDLIQFTLRYYQEDLDEENFKVICLNSEKYKHFHRGHRAYNYLSNVFIQEFLELFSNFINDSLYLLKYKKTIEELNNPDLDEYGKVVSLNELLSDDQFIGSRACCVELDKINPLIFLNPILYSKYVNDEISTFSKICDRGKKLKYIILIRNDLFCNQNPNKRSEDIIHESIHIYESLIKKSFPVNKIDEMTIEIAAEFKKNK